MPVWLIRLLVILGALGLLELACRIGWVDPFTMPPPSLMLLYSWQVLASGRMNADILLTLQNVSVAFVLAVLIGFLIGVLLHRWPRLRRAVDPLLASYYAVPFFIFYPLFIVIFGLNNWPLIAIGFLFAVVAMVINTLNGFDRVPRVLLKPARVHGLSRAGEVCYVTLPAAAPYLFTGVKLSVPAVALPSVACSSAVADTAPGAGPIPSGIALGSSPASAAGGVAAASGDAVVASGAGVAAGSSAGACGWQAASIRAAGNSRSRAWRMAGSPRKRGIEPSPVLICPQ